MIINVDDWELETFIPSTAIYVSKNNVLLVSTKDNQLLAKLSLEDNNVVIEFSTVQTNVPVTGIKGVQFLVDRAL